ncbi:dihydroorotate dehydrogenase [Aggregatilinea lenta]|uniref:dihydroorotate dehydrogenase n=1 Tax=Aggregatilinea lenta TaxID=913108 RepID=UPI000E5AFB58|nr:dihydroorotate dehydrogenase [Aggregatilinea lenta]
MIELTRPGKTTLVVENPVMPAAGTVGFDGSAYADLIDLKKLGAIVTNPVSWRPRHAARGSRVVPLPAGALVHTGLPNGGITRVIKQYAARWARSYAPIIVHLIGTHPDDVARCAAALDGREGVAGIELGLHDQASPQDVAILLDALLSATQIPVLVQVPLYNALTLAQAAQDAGAGGLVIAAAPRGTARDPETGQLVGGRVYGPWLHAQALRALGQIAQIAQIPLIGCGGIHSANDARDYLEAGASAVQVDTLTWVQPKQLEVIARNLGGLELTRASGALADEWEPGIGDTILLERKGKRRKPADPPESLPE